MTTKTDRILSARVLGILAATLMGFGIAVLLVGMDVGESENAGAQSIGGLCSIVGAVIATLGLFVAVASTSDRARGRIAHVLLWILLPTLAVFGLCRWMWWTRTYAW